MFHSADGESCMLPPRDFLNVRLRVENEIRRGCESNAREASVRVVDEWAAEVVGAHIGTSRFPLQAQAEFAVAAAQFYFGMLGGGRNQPPEVSQWVSECNLLMNDRLRYWVEISARFRASKYSKLKRFL